MNHEDEAQILVVNGGSSSVKFALFAATAGRPLRVRGTVQRVGSPHASFGLRVHGERESRPDSSVSIPDQAACIGLVLDWLARENRFDAVVAVGHRIVHGGPRFTSSQHVTADVLDELRRLSPYDPAHLPAEIAWIEAIAERKPELLQIVCFDTTFHRDLPQVARLLAIPRRYAAMGIVRYGFHGLSFASSLRTLARVAGATAATGRVIVAHLGNGSSMAAVHGGQSIDTTMSFTPMSGLPMSTRSGDLDPGLVAYLAELEGMSIADFHHMVSAESGLLGVSETSSDMRDLLERAAGGDARAEDAVALYCYAARKCIGAYTAALGGLDTLVFTGGIGEHSDAVRMRICTGLECLGIELDAESNAQHAPVISARASRVTVRVLPADEEGEIADAVLQHMEAR